MYACVYIYIYIYIRICIYKETPEAWGESLGRFLATPLTALLDHELAQASRAICLDDKQSLRHVKQKGQFE